MKKKININLNSNIEIHKYIEISLDTASNLIFKF